VNANKVNKTRIFKILLFIIITFYFWWTKIIT